MALALLASLISIRLGLSVALTEIVFGVAAGNAFHLQTNEWINFLAGFGSIVLTFLAGAEIEPAVLRRNLSPTMAIGIVAFVAPFGGAMTFALLVGWDPKAAQIAGLALSTTSVAVVYAVMVETGLNETELGKVILAACFVNDVGTVALLGVLFANYDLWLVPFLAGTVPVLALYPKVARWLSANMRGRVGEPEIKLLFLALLFLGGLAVAAGSEAVLPAYLLGMVAAGLFGRDAGVGESLGAQAF